MWKLSIEDDQGTPTVVPLARSEYTLGRAEDNSVRLTERNISRNHARLVKQGASWFLVDQNSYNGCFVNGARIAEPHPIGPSDLVQIGDYRLELITDQIVQDTSGASRPALASNTLPSIPAADSSSTDRLVMVVGPTPGREYVLSRDPQSIGRGEDCDICINHGSVSRRHAQVTRLEAGRYELVDQGSSNGLRINGVELRRGLLDLRDIVEIGDVVLRFIPKGEHYRPTAEETRQLTALLGLDLAGESATLRERLGALWHTTSPTVRWGTVLLASMVVALFVSVALTNQRKAPVAIPSTQSSVARWTAALSQAHVFVETGDLESAQRSILMVPASSNLRQSEAYRTAVGHWADASLHRAEQSTTPEEQRALLLRVATFEGIDPALRERAETELARLSTVALDAGPVAEAGVALDAGPVAEAGVALDAGSEANTAPTQAEPAREPAAKPRISAPSALVGKAVPSANPSVSDSRAAELATRGDAASALKAKQALLAKQATTPLNATEQRLLRALCRQLKDPSCSN